MVKTDFLVCTVVGVPGDQHDLGGQVTGDHGLGDRAVALWVGGEAGQVDDGEFRREVGLLLRGCLDQEMLDEEGVPRQLGDDPARQAVGQVGAAVKILNKELLALGMGQHVGQQRVELGLRHWRVGIPPDGVFGLGGADDKLVFGGAPGVLACFDDQRPFGGNFALAALNGQLKEHRGAQVPVFGFQIFKPWKAISQCLDAVLGHFYKCSRLILPGSRGVTVSARMRALLICSD